MKMYFVEKEGKRVLISYNPETMPKYVQFPLRARVYISAPFQLSYIEAYIKEGWNVDMSQRVRRFWNARPASFDTRHDSRKEDK